MARIYTVSNSEAQLFKLALEPGGGNVFTGYFFSRNPGVEIGWQFDNNFVEEGKYQLAVHHDPRPRITIVGGYASGKTWTVGISASVWGSLLNNFAFINIAPTFKQSKIMYNNIIQAARDTPFSNLIWRYSEHPYPKIQLRFKIGKHEHHSTLEFWSGYDTNNLLTAEVDWLNIEQAESFDTLDDVLMDAGSRVRGAISGRQRMGRLSLIANSGDNPTLWQQVDYASELPDQYAAYIVSTKHNKNVTEEQLAMMMRDVPEDQIAQKFDGGRPEGRGLEFSRDSVLSCESEMLDELLMDGITRELDGYNLVRKGSAGVVEYCFPRLDGHDYILIGDPGKGNAPYRNAPVWMCIDITAFPFRIAAFWWGDGNGSLDPFINKMFAWAKKYRPIYTAVDNTGPQSGTVEVINRMIQSDVLSQAEFSKWQKFGQNNQEMQDRNMDIFLSGMDFSGSKKVVYLLAAQSIISATLLTWPKMVRGLRVQLLNYDKNKDRGSTTKLAQDLVSVIAMVGYVLSNILHDRKLEDETPDVDSEEEPYGFERSLRADVDAREVRRNVRPGRRA